MAGGRKLKTWVPGDPILAEDLNAMAREIERIGRLTVSSPMELLDSQTGMFLSMKSVDLVGRYRLDDAMYKGMSVGTPPTGKAILGDGSISDAETDLFPDYIRGYFFDGQDVLAARFRDSQKWYVIGCGTIYAWGTLSGALNSASSASLTVDGNSKVITVYEKWGTASSGALIGVLWNDDKNRWEGALQKCSS